MRGLRTGSTFAALVVALLLPGVAHASPLSDFQARLAQTIWACQQTEAILRSLPQSSAAVSTPEGLSSHAALLSENVAALNAIASVRLTTDEQRRALSEGLRAVNSILHDQAAMAGNRGLTAVVSSLQSLEESCRTTQAQLSSQRR